jgi:hypothetical protein
MEVEMFIFILILLGISIDVIRWISEKLLRSLGLL